MFGGAYYILQRVLKTKTMFNDTLSKIHFWGWQLIITLGGASSLILGYTTSKEYAELEWPI
jgi:cytochrome c oxidase cbb3-type subunit I/II